VVDAVYGPEPETEADRRRACDRADRDYGDYRIGRRVDYRHGIRIEICDVRVSRKALSAAENTGKGKGREQPGNSKLHASSLTGDRACRPRDGLIRQC
jgi:hypothetical protein